MTSTVLLWSSFLKKDIPVIHRKTVNWMQLNLGLKSIWLQQTLKLAKKNRIMHELTVSLRWKWNVRLAVKSGIWDAFLLDSPNALWMCVREERKDGYCELTFALQRLYFFALPEHVMLSLLVVVFFLWKILF